MGAAGVSLWAPIAEVEAVACHWKQALRPLSLGKTMGRVDRRERVKRIVCV